jgi:hypothetical protein
MRMEYDGENPPPRNSLDREPLNADNWNKLHDALRDASLEYLKKRVTSAFLSDLSRAMIGYDSQIYYPPIGLRPPLFDPLGNK